MNKYEVQNDRIRWREHLQISARGNQIGRAEATNPMLLVIPCHRVLGADGGLHGYGAGKGIETKAWLLELEGVD